MRKVNRTWLPSGIIGGIASVILTLAGCLLGAWMIIGGTIPQRWGAYWVMAILAVSSFGGSLLSCRRAETKGIAASAVSAFVYIVLLWLIWLAYGERGGEGILPTILMVLCGTALADGSQFMRNRRAARSNFRFH